MERNILTETLYFSKIFSAPSSISVVMKRKKNLCEKADDGIALFLFILF